MSTELCRVGEKGREERAGEREGVRQLGCEEGEGGRLWGRESWCVGVSVCITSYSD